MHAAAAPHPPTLTISGRFCGPPESGNGGYTCGLLAAAFGGTVEVTLRQPPPLDRPLALLRRPDGLVLDDGGHTVAEAVRTRLDLTPPPCPGLGAATAAAARFPGLERHAFPTCFVCGPGRAADDGLRIFAGATGEDSLVACPWTPAPELADEHGRLRTEFTWAALDCPGAWAWLATMDNPLVLGRLAVSIDAPILAGRPHVVGGWQLGREGRKHYSGTVIWRADGSVCARGRATWIEVDAARFGASG